MGIEVLLLLFELFSTKFVFCNLENLAIFLHQVLNVKRYS